MNALSFAGLHRLPVFLVSVVLAGSGLVLSPSAAPAPAGRVLFETGFEKSEGYEVGLDLVGQNGWTAFGTGGNGILGEPLAGFQGQYAYIGFSAPPTNQLDPFNIWRPVDLKPTGGGLPVVQFTVTLQIEDSTTAAPRFDDFRWSAYSVAEHRFFTIDFDNDLREINYILDDGIGGKAPIVRPTGFAFRNGEPYDLVVTMDFARNLWSAKLNDVVVVHAKPITTSGAKLDLGDIDAVWAVRDPARPGDNYMVFDDYQIVATPLDDIPPELEVVGSLATTGAFIVRVLGEPGVTYTLEATSDFVEWIPVATAKAPSPDGYVDLQDIAAPANGARFYRAVSKP